MVNVMGGNYIIIGEMAVQWMPSAAKIPVEEDPPKAVYPVWLMDSLGIRAAIFVRCPTCQSPLGISPNDAAEQVNWNKEDPEINSILGCGRCSNMWMITAGRAYHLQLLPVQQSKTPRVLGKEIHHGA